MEGWTEDHRGLSAHLCSAIAVERVCITGSISRCAGDGCPAPSYIAHSNCLRFSMAGSQFRIASADKVSWPNY